jgi:hypothetical protein
MQVILAAAGLTLTGMALPGACVAEGIEVEGAAVAVGADSPCWPAEGDADADNRYVDCGNGTVLDRVTGLLWLRDARCLLAPATWWEAQAFAAQLASGQCGLTDHSQPGDWRLPTEADWAATVAQAVAWACTDAGVGDPPSLTNDPGTACLDVGPTSFLNLPECPACVYWTATANEAQPSGIWLADLASGSTDGSALRSSFLFSWPVRDGL